MKLYELTQNFKNLEEVLNNTEDNDIKELILNSMNEVSCDLSTKVENIVKLIRNLQADAEAVKTEEQRLCKLRKQKEKQVEGLQKYLFDCISSLERREVKGGIFTVSVKKNPPKTVIDDINAIPKEFIINVPTLDKKALKEVLKEGQKIDGARLVREESLRIK